MIDHRTSEGAAQDAPDSLAVKYREMAADLDRERAAEEWCEGLLADAQ